MSLSRAFTSRKFRMSTASSADDKAPQRAQTLRHKISAPVQLIHTTNLLSYNAPDLPHIARSKSATRSEDDSDSVATNESTPPTSPDVPSNHPSVSPQPNHLSGYFKKPSKPIFPAESEPAPAIPKRSPSHTKKSSYEAIARSHSVSRISRDSEMSTTTGHVRSISRTLSTSTMSTRTSSGSAFRPPQKQPVPLAPLSLPVSTPQPLPQPAKEAHPFGPELAQVTELAEEYGSNSQLELEDEDAESLQSRGLVKLGVNDYLGAIQELSSFFFPETNHSAAVAPLWI